MIPWTHRANESDIKHIAEFCCSAIAISAWQSLYFENGSNHAFLGFFAMSNLLAGNNAALAVNSMLRAQKRTIDLSTLGSRRIFVEAIKKYCFAHDIAVEVRSEGWLIVMRRGVRRHLAFAYDIGLNSAAAHQIANDKAATAEVLKLAGIPHIPHALFLGPKLAAYASASGSRQAMLDLLQAHRDGLVVKPNGGTSGDCVFKVTTAEQLAHAAAQIFAAYPSLAISPYVDIEDEVRVVLVDDDPLVVYRKERPVVTGDGRHTLLELARETIPAEARPAVLPSLSADLDEAALGAILPVGERRILNWRHNLDCGAQPVLLEQGPSRDICIQLAIKAAQALGIRFGSIDVVRAADAWQILEMNAAVKMEALSRSHPELVQATYDAALDKVFASRRPGARQDP